MVRSGFCFRRTEYFDFRDSLRHRFCRKHIIESHVGCMKRRSYVGWDRPSGVLRVPGSEEICEARILKDGEGPGIKILWMIRISNMSGENTGGKLPEGFMNLVGGREGIEVSQENNILVRVCFPGYVAGFRESRFRVKGVQVNAQDQQIPDRGLYLCAEASVVEDLFMNRLHRSNGDGVFCQESKVKAGRGLDHLPFHAQPFLPHLKRIFCGRCEAARFGKEEEVGM